MGLWRIELSNEVADWYASLPVKGLAQADRALDRLSALGPALRMPHSRSLNDGLFELRFTCGDRTQRITSYFEPERAVIMLTVFAKQRQNERREVLRARRAMPKGRGQDHDH